ncbi:MAG: type II toxin-antitoxin system RelE/ParE family toxin [Pirellulales bacterium]
MYRLVISAPAEVDIQSAYAWWCSNRSTEQADRWYECIRLAILDLADRADQFAIAPESDLVATGLRQRNVGIGRRPTHRVVFTVTSEEVVVIRVRHLAQDALMQSEV